MAEHSAATEAGLGRGGWGPRVDGLDPVVLDVDGAIVRQKRLLGEYGPAVIPLREKSEELRYWSSKESLGWLGRVFRAEVGPMEGKLLFYGSGDYHHLSYSWVGMLKEPVSVIHFDNHTDWTRSPGGGVHLGSWVAHALDEVPHVVRKVVQFGVDGDLNLTNNAMGLPLPIGMPSHDMRLMDGGKVEVYPTAVRRSTLVGSVRATNPSAEFEPGTTLTTRVRWRNFRDHGGIEAVLGRVLPTLPTEAVYLTIDKDALREEDAFTNYYRGSQGPMTLDELLSAISVIRKHKRIVAADVVGDGSRPAVRRLSDKGLFRRIKDKQIPKDLFDSPATTRLNEEANLEIAQALSGAP